MSKPSADTFDYVVTGAGSAGCAVAARLSESGRYSVALLEAGPPDTNPWIHIPIGFTQVFTDASVNWKFESAPVAALNNRSLYQPRGKVLGGSSSINGTVYMRGTPADYDNWRQSGCEGWDWDSVLPFFKKAENQERGTDAWHGVGGPLNVSDIAPSDWPLARAMVAAAIEAGVAPNADFNGAQQEGTGFYQFTASKGRRVSTARAYLKPAAKRANLRIITGAHASKILFSGTRAVGVEYLSANGTHSVHATREIVVSGGTFGSPQLLALSGLGPAQQLQALGVQVLRDMPGVGAHLHDHFNTYLSFRCAQAVTFNDLALSLPRKLMAGMRYALSRSGPLSNTGICAGAMIRSDERFENPDLQINMLAFSTADRRPGGLVPHPFSAFTISPVHLRPEGRGSVTLNSADPRDPPRIQFEFLTSDYDRKAILYGMRFCREIARQPALKSFTVEEVMPGATVESDEALLEDVRARAIANYHPVGTCRMGHQVDAVVDPRLRVHGISGLRVADASIMPQIIAGNTNAPSIMIGEKAAAMILDDA
jgi:choline dehydrogenase